MDRIDRKIVTIVGRPSWPRSAGVLERLEAGGAILRRGLTRRTDLLVIGRGAYRMLDDGRLARKIALADRYGARCLSEGGLGKMLTPMSAAETADAILTIETMTAQTGLDRATLRLLSLFDLMADEGEGLGFRDLVTGREVARLFGEGASLEEIVRGVGQLERGQGGRGDQPLARHKLVTTGEGDLALRFGDGLAEFDGQMRMALPEGGNPSVQDLFEEAEEAEIIGDFPGAEALYHRCIDLDKKDPTARFNLANVLREQARGAEALQCLKVVVSMDPGFAEAWYNLADLAESGGDLGGAKRHLGRALEADGDYADAVFNLASLHFRDGEIDAAMVGWRRYLALDKNSKWSRKAREGVMLCRERLRVS